MRLTSPSRRAAGLLAVSTIGLSTVLLSVAGTASAETTPTTPTTPATTTFSTDPDADVTADHAGIWVLTTEGDCTISWDLVGAAGGAGYGGGLSQDGGLGGRYTATTHSTDSAAFVLRAGSAGQDGDVDGRQPGMGGVNSAEFWASDGAVGTRDLGTVVDPDPDAADDDVYGGGGGAASVVETYDGDAYLGAFGGDGGFSAGGAGAGGLDGVNEDHTDSIDGLGRTPSGTGDGVISGSMTCTDPDSSGGDLPVPGGTSPGTSPVDEGPVVTLPAPVSAGLKAGVQSLTFQWAPPSDTEGLTGYTMEAYLQYDEDVDPATIPVGTTSVLSCDAPAGATSCTVLAAAGFTYAGFVQTVYGEEYGDYTDTGVSAVVSGPAAPSATLPKADGTLTSNATDGKVVAGQQITISGTDFLPGSTVDLVVYSTPVALGTATVLADGTFTATVTLPESLEDGVHHLVATGVDVTGNVRTLVVEVTVSGGSAVLAFTGFSALPYAGAGALALLAGGGLLVVSRRRLAA